MNLFHTIQIPANRFIIKGSLVEKTFSKNALLCSISFILLYRSPGRSSPSSQLLVMNPVFFMPVYKDIIISFHLLTFYNPYSSFKLPFYEFNSYSPFQPPAHCSAGQTKQWKIFAAECADPSAGSISVRCAALVSDVAGTTTDPVYQAMEVHGLGPCVFIDTAGFDDEGELGALRVEKTLKVMQKADVALLVCRDEEVKDELHWLQLLKEKQIPTLLVLNKADLLPQAETVADAISEKAGVRPLVASARTGEGVEGIREALIRMASETVQPAIVSHLVSEGDLVLLVMHRQAGRHAASPVAPAATDHHRLAGVQHRI